MHQCYNKQNAIFFVLIKEKTAQISAHIEIYENQIQFELF